MITTKVPSAERNRSTFSTWPVWARLCSSIAPPPPKKCGPTTVRLSLLLSSCRGASLGNRKGLQISHFITLTLIPTQLLPVNVKAIPETAATRSGQRQRKEQRRTKKSTSLQFKSGANVQEKTLQSETRKYEQTRTNKISSLSLQATFTAGTHLDCTTTVTACSPTKCTAMTSEAALSVSQQLRGTACPTLDDNRRLHSYLQHRTSRPTQCTHPCAATDSTNLRRQTSALNNNMPLPPVAQQRDS